MFSGGTYSSPLPYGQAGSTGHFGFNSRSHIHDAHAFFTAWLVLGPHIVALIVEIMLFRLRNSATVTHNFKNLQQLPQQDGTPYLLF
jgi:hypothetical protein